MRRRFLYRFPDESEYVRVMYGDEQGGHTLSWNSGVRIYPGVYRLRSSEARKPRMSIGEYLGPGLGKGGQYTGFFEYLGKTLEKVTLQHTGLDKAKGLFGTNRRCVFFLFDEEWKVFDEDEPGRVKAIQHVSPHELSCSITAEADVVKWMNLGSLMKMEHQNNAEYNFVGDGHFPVLIIDSNNLKDVHDVLERALSTKPVVLRSMLYTPGSSLQQRADPG